MLCTRYTGWSYYTALLTTPWASDHCLIDSCTQLEASMVISPLHQLTREEFPVSVHLNILVLKPWNTLQNWGTKFHRSSWTVPSAALPYDNTTLLKNYLYQPENAILVNWELRYCQVFLQLVIRWLTLLLSSIRREEGSRREQWGQALSL